MTDIEKSEVDTESLVDDMASQEVNNNPGGPPDGLSSINPVFYNTVANLIKQLKMQKQSLFDKVSGKLSKKNVQSSPEPDKISQVKPQAPVLADSGIQSASNESPKLNKGLIRKLIVLLVVVFIISGLIISGRKLFNFIPGNTGGNTEIVNTANPTPTPGEGVPLVPSIYSDDEVLLQLEKDILILDQELTTSVLRENALDPPKLDFNISF